MIRMHSGSTPVPVTRNMPFSSTSVPSRGSNIKNNMTGIYLGLEGNMKPPKPRSATVPPLIRRGGSQRIRTPTEHRSYNKVELLRVKEETRGFRGQPVKRRKQMDLDHSPEQGKENVSPRSRVKQWGPAKSINSNEFADIIRQNPRRYTVVVNNGVTRSENLTGFHSFVENPGADILNIPYSDVLIEEVHRITNNRNLLGLEECYKKVCKGKIDSLQSLLPLRKNGQHRDNSFATGFTVRSYQNPQRAEIMADFDGNQAVCNRPKTVPVNRQPLVPAPYFFRFYNKPGTASSQRTKKTPASQFEDQFDSLHGTAKIIAAPGVGALSRSLKTKNNAGSDASGEANPNKSLRRGTSWNSAAGDTSGKEMEGRPRVKISHQEAADTVKHSVQPTYPTRGQGSEGSQSQVEPVDIPSSARTEELPSTGHEPLTDRSELSTGREERNKEESKEQPQTSHLETSISDNLSEGIAEPGLSESITQSRIVDDMDGRIRGDDHQMKTERELMKAKRANSSDIVLELETEDGQHTDVHIDDAQLKDDHEGIKESEAKIASLKMDAEKRIKDFEQILDEHAEIVREISRRSSTSTISVGEEGHRDQ